MKDDDDLFGEAMTEKEKRIFEIARKIGYKDCLDDYGIWKDGIQTIGCLQTPIKEAYARKFPE